MKIMVLDNLITVLDNSKRSIITVLNKKMVNNYGLKQTSIVIHNSKSFLQ